MATYLKLKFVIKKVNITEFMLFAILLTTFDIESQQ